MSFTPSRYLEWHLVETDAWDGNMHRIADSRNKVVCLVYDLDIGEAIVAEHDKALRARDEWLHAESA